MATNGALTAKQEKALAFFMTSPTVAEAAQKSGLGHRTLVRWFGEDVAFKTAYLAARRHAMSQTIVMLQQSTGEAVTALREVMVDSDLPANARVSASKVILDIAMKGLEMEDLELRISILENERGHVKGKAKGSML
jgi:hypothetical protein